MKTPPSTSHARPSPCRSFRLVCTTAEISQVEAFLQAQGFIFEPEPFCAFARRLTHEPFPLGRSLAAFFGLIYIQDRSSMLPALALAPAQGARVLDMCASPGSKTGLLAQLVGSKGFVLGNEPTRTRLATLRRNLQALNLLQAATCSWPGQELPLPDASWEWILLDPPCSGWGTTDKHPNVTELWKGEKVRPLVNLQRELLHKAARLLKPGGHLVYSTCTTNVDENEAQVRFALGLDGASNIGLELEPLTPPAGFIFDTPALPGCEGVLRVHETSDGQGFFIARFAKRADAPMPIEATSSTSSTATRRTIPGVLLREAGLDPRLLPPGEPAAFGDSLHFLPRQALESLPAALRWQGMNLGKLSGGRPVFSPRLRSLISPDVDGVTRLDMDTHQDIERLLQGQSFTLGLTGRFAALFWQGLPLGLARLKNGRVLWTEK